MPWSDYSMNFLLIKEIIIIVILLFSGPVLRRWNELGLYMIIVVQPSK